MAEGGENTPILDIGPDCLPELLRVTRPGALFCCGTIPAVLDGAGFGSALAALVAQDAISPVRFRQIDIYDAGADHAHNDDSTQILLLRQSPGVAPDRSRPPDIEPFSIDRSPL